MYYLIVYLTIRFLMINSPFFYIMLPTFNRPELIIRSVNSLIQQSYLNYKLVIFNDGSTKDYSELEILIDGHDKIEYIRSPNIGINKSRNMMIESFLKKSNENSYFFTLSDDDYLVEDSLAMMVDEIIKKPSIWYCFNSKSNSQNIFKNSDFLNYEVLKYSEFVKNYRGDKHFVFQLKYFKNIRYPGKYFKNGFEHLFYYQIPSEIQTIPITVKVIEYYEDGLSLSNLYDNQNSLDVRIRELKSVPFKWLFYKNLIMYFLKPKNILKNLISEDRYYKAKKKLGLKGRRNKIKL